MTQRIFADKNLRIIYSVTLMAVMGVGVIAPALPQMARDLSLTPQAVGMLITAFTVPGVILAPLLGVLADRHGRRRILVPSLFLFAIAGAACALARDFTVLLALRVRGALLWGLLATTLLGLPLDVTQWHGLVANPPDRCYHCKTELYAICARIAHENDLAVIVNGLNTEDLSDHRPGNRAAVLDSACCGGRRPPPRPGPPRPPSWAIMASRSISGVAIPMAIRNAPTRLMKELGYGKAYRYAHDEPGGYAAGEDYLPEELEGARFYHPVARGLEIKIAEKLDQLGFDQIIEIDADGKPITKALEQTKVEIKN